MADNLNPSETATAWAEIVIEIWEDKMERLKVNRTLDLINSLLFHVNTAANGNVEMIQFFFNYYGKFVDMGVGKGLPAGLTLINAQRMPKPWYSKVFYSQVIRLSEIMAEKFANRAAITIVNNIDDNRMVI